ncbi:MucBP domain-containing protein [Enterococcus faecalis]|uniref:MucBP domain-containing protein n=1 Tax=Enterococcus faecalis TaxID=1351 RepID=UPI0008790011|nr:MucBP domain-containing protein [Enterococcus faecalis]MCA6712251.1 MucBP domain-containing protein [Enterococcus faecalis]MCA6731223.1 MucBP domain-containing protein [Enterococcus faecalis]OFA12727.1 internalin-J precursor [Enterococcus faecalis]
MGLNTTGEPIGAYLGVNFTNDVLVINSKVIINFGGVYSASEFLGSLHAKITSDYYVTIRVTSEGKTYSNTYFNFFGNPNKQGTIQVKYVDEEGREIFPTETMTGNVGDSYETQAKEITGYILKERLNNASGTYKEENQTVTYIYIKIPDYYVMIPKSVKFTDTQMSSDVSVKILNKDGQNYTGKDSVQVNVFSVNNFKLKDTSTNKFIPYSIDYQNNSLDNANNLVGVLSKNNVCINGIAKLLSKDNSGKQYKYMDNLIYDITLL